MPKIQLEGLNSIYEEPNISTSIKENPYAANVELEGKGKGRKGEVVLRPDGEALHDVIGKRHYAGGVQTWLPEGSFVFSDFKDLALSKRDHEFFELKEGGSYKKTDNTPAEVLRRNIDVKHYNKMSETLTNKYKDSISKKTSELMLKKYQEKLGQIAFLQESKKGFPEGEPLFSQGTAPVYETEFKEEIMEQKQYMKGGGRVLPKYQKGKIYSGGDTPGTIGTDGSRQTPSAETQQSRSWWPDMSQKLCPPGFYKDVITGQCVSMTKSNTKVDTGYNITEGNPSPVEMPWQFTPWQKYSMGLGFKNYAGANRLMPMRSQINSPLLELEGAVEPDYLGELASGFRASELTNPYLAGANNAQIYGQMLNAKRSSSAGNINANNQIMNQQNLMNNQIQRQDLQTNIGADQQYYNQVQQSRQNFDNLRSTIREQNRGELMSNVQANEQLAMAMARMGKDRPFDYNFRTGQIYHTGRGDIMSQVLPQTQDEYLKLASQLKKEGFSDTVISAIIKSSAFNKLQPRIQKMGGYNPYRR